MQVSWHQRRRQRRCRRDCRALVLPSPSSWSQSKRAKPTHTDPEDDRRVDPALPSGSTSKTWNPAKDQWFWSDLSDPNSTARASKGMPPSIGGRCFTQKEMCAASVAGDTSEGSTAGPRLGPWMLDEDTLRTLRERVNRLGVVVVPEDCK